MKREKRKAVAKSASCAKKTTIQRKSEHGADSPFRSSVDNHSPICVSGIPLDHDDEEDNGSSNDSRKETGVRKKLTFALETFPEDDAKETNDFFDYESDEEMSDTCEEKPGRCPKMKRNA